MGISKKSEIDTLSHYLLRLCDEHGVIDPMQTSLVASDDLIDGGFIDSMGLAYMQSIIAEEFSVEISPEMLITELRNIHSIAAYLVEKLPPKLLQSYVNKHA